IGRITTAGAVAEYPLAAGADPAGIAAGPDGALWFTEPAADRVGRIATDGMIAEYPVPTPGAEPTAIAAGPDGALWVTEFTAGRRRPLPVPTSPGDRREPERQHGGPRRRGLDRRRGGDRPRRRRRLRDRAEDQPPFGQPPGVPRARRPAAHAGAPALRALDRR